MPTNKKDISRFASKVVKFHELNSELKQLQYEVETVKSELKSAIQRRGSTAPNGNKFLDVIAGDDEYVISEVLRIQAKLNDDAVLLIEKLLPDARLIETIKVVRTDKLESMIKAGKISARIVKRLYTTTESYAFNCKKDETKKSKHKR